PVAQTFSGLDVKKSPPVLLFVGIAALAFIGLGLGGFALVRGRSAAAGAVSDQPASSAVVARATTSAPVTVDSAPVATPAENAPAKDPAAKDPSPLASA
ncbi:hypothetical protein G6O46_24040, partial [Salmonella enterica subsp. enterica serovar Enteritidis]|uniref:hypothetical protein n=1 Tax=Salmonella enterica TaxID=28901 RepID=UPI0018C8A202